METTRERLIREADELIDRLMDERARWSGYVAMDIKLTKLIRMAQRRRQRRAAEEAA